MTGEILQVIGIALSAFSIGCSVAKRVYSSEIAALRKEIVRLQGELGNDVRLRDKERSN